MFRSPAIAAAVLCCSLASATVQPHVDVGFDGSKCALGLGPIQDADTVPATLKTFAGLGNGAMSYEYGCGQGDYFRWGPGLSQNFAGSAIVRGFGEAGPGYLRAYGSAETLISPFFYGAGFAEGNNPYYAYAQHLGGPSFVEVVTPPPTTAAPNPGDPTSIAVTLTMHCGESNAPGNLFIDTTISAQFFTEDGFTQNPRLGYFDSVFAHTDVVHGTLHYPCGFVVPKTVAGHVGEPIVIRVGIGIFAAGGTAYYPYQAGWSEWSDALNTATTVFSDADGHPLTGASGHVYSDLSLPVYTTTTTTTSSTSTLPPAPATCGNGVLDAGEACDCAATDDPVLQVAGCKGANVIPVQQTCVICRSCQIVSTLCPSAAPTTTTTVPGATTTTLYAATTTTVYGATTTTVSRGATTTTQPGTCVVVAPGTLRAACLLQADLTGPLCGDEPLPPKVDARLRAKLGSAEKMLVSAAAKSGRAQARQLKRSRHLLAAAGALADRAAHARNAKRHISATCATGVHSLISGAISELSST
jgi:hypothetical protein